MRRWLRLGALLPRDVRERVFEPAFSDMARRWLTLRGGSRVPFGIHAFATYLACLPIAVPSCFVKAGKLTRLGRVTLWTAAVVLVVSVAWVRVTSGYAATG